MGWLLDVPAPERITPDALVDALCRQPAISKYRPCNAERCILACLYVRPQR